ncbi:MAG TPA: 2-amino-4-hydroxy-6-hydroxymethyldihydropteridine diphosphokinase [Chthoniobacterales bacterium]|nr:2-amino-4-hydroxy-6-hydroxymethyldihydropteridine diphosphokinase [Chthoniobacterales bacterium]
MTCRICSAFGSLDRSPILRDSQAIARSPLKFVLMRCGIALGSNIEDRLENLREGCRRASALHEPGPPIRSSSIYETSPLDCEPGTAPYLNAVMEINFTGPPVALLDRLLEIEKAMGRSSKRPRNSPRAIDLDILYVGNLVLNNPEIIIPHPRIHLRRFVLAPLAEIAPDLVLPGHQRPVESLLGQLNDRSEVTRLDVALNVRE